jgi:hypothetical protein
MLARNAAQLNHNDGGKIMGMEFWLIPVLAMLVAGVGIFYMIIRHHGGTGARADGHTVLDKTPPEQSRHASWNYYK